MSSYSYIPLAADLDDCAVRIVDRDRVANVRASMPSDEQVAELADVFGLLADPGRLRVLTALLEGEMCVCDLAAAAGASESAASHHLRLLRAHRVVQVRRSGRMAYYQLADAHVRLLLDIALTHVGHAPAAAHPERSSPGPRRAVKQGAHRQA
jgi:ArsR family transcriptional regulator, lead/cadmium/zinc/bismuth-responsive transcriptional repressor